jgi:peptide-methionine (R)-S-oxide reductase
MDSLQHEGNPYFSTTDTAKLHLELSELKKILPPELYHVAFEKGTERPFTGKFEGEHADGVFRCAVCGYALFASDTKFDSGTGWPSFYQPLEKDRVSDRTDTGLGMIRDEVLCARCGAHLGHVFDDGPRPTGLRYCINAVSLELGEE